MTAVNIKTLTIKLSQVWRVLATAFCFAAFGSGALCISFIIIPVTKIIVPLTKFLHYRAISTQNIKHNNQIERELKIQRFIQLSFKFFCQLMKFTRAINYQVIGAEKLTQDKGCLVIANHPSLIDYVLITALLPQCDCLVKSSIWQNPFMRYVVKGAGYIPNQNAEDLFKQCQQRLDLGHLLLIFPEGTRTTPGIPEKLQRGAAQIALRTESDIRIIHLKVTPSFLTKEIKWYQVPKKRPFFSIEIKDRVEIQPFIKQTNSLTIAARQLNSHLTSAIAPH